MAAIKAEPKTSEPEKKLRSALAKKVKDLTDTSKLPITTSPPESASQPGRRVLPTRSARNIVYIPELPFPIGQLVPAAKAKKKTPPAKKTGRHAFTSTSKVVKSGQAKRKVKWPTDGGRTFDDDRAKEYQKQEIAKDALNDQRTASFELKEGAARDEIIEGEATEPGGETTDKVATLDMTKEGVILGRTIGRMRFEAPG